VILDVFSKVENQKENVCFVLAQKGDEQEAVVCSHKKNLALLLRELFFLLDFFLLHFQESC
tara:strand:+ start:113 stop:295 length:183 start_codon:yes stop_codon:yes gene_type:complete